MIGTARVIEPRQLAERLGEPSLRVVDATVFLDRPPGGGPYTPRPQREAYERAHVPGAVFADLVNELADPAAPHPFALPGPEAFAAAAGRLGIGTGTEVVAYAQAEPTWATRLWWLLRFHGFDDVHVLDGGLTAWRAAGLPLEAGAAAYPPATFQARRRPELLATRADVEAVVAGGSACLVNALEPRVFRGEGPTSYSRPGRIPGSVNVPWAGLVDPATQRLRPLPELERALGPTAGEDPVIAYCGGGISASMDVFALALTGRDAKLYDGSLTEWTADPELPVELG